MICNQDIVLFKCLQNIGHRSVPEKNKKGDVEVRTAHSLNPVPFIIYDKDARHELKDGDFGLANVAPTIADLMGIKPFDSWEESMLL